MIAAYPASQNGAIDVRPDVIDTLSILVLLLALGGPIAIAQIRQRSVAGATRLSLNLLLQLLLAGLAITCLWIALGPLRVPASDLGFGLPDLHTWLWGGAMSVFFIFGLGPILLRMPLWLDLNGFAEPLSALADLPIWCLVLASFWARCSPGCGAKKSVWRGRSG